MIESDMEYFKKLFTWDTWSDNEEDFDDDGPHAFSSKRTETEKLLFRGLVTKISTNLVYAECEREEFVWEKTVPTTGARPRHGSLVELQVERKGPDKEWVVQSVYVMADDGWDFSADKIGSAPGSSQIGRVVKVEGSKITIKSDEEIILEGNAIKCDFVLRAGDWVSVKKGDTDECPEHVQPLRLNTLQGSVTTLGSVCGSINNEIWFNPQSCISGYIPRLHDPVEVTAIESDQGNYTWRATSVVPKVKERIPAKVLRTMNSGYGEHTKKLLEDKEGIVITENLFYGNVTPGSRKQMTATLTNTSRELHILQAIRIQQDKTEPAFEIQYPFLNGADSENGLEKSDVSLCEGSVSINPGARLHVRLMCNGSKIGRRRSMCVFEFDGFSIGRYLVADVFCGKGSTIHKPNQENWMVPGRKTKKTLNFIPFHLPAFDVPSYLWKVVDEGSDYLLAMPVLGEQLRFQNYREKFRSLLYLEDINIALGMMEFDMVGIKFELSGPYLKLEVPGLAEGRPSLLLGDTVLASDPQRPTQPLYEGYIHEICASHVLLKFHANFHELKHQDLEYDVTFKCSRSVIKRCHMAVDVAMKQLGERVLFPLKLTMNFPQVTWSNESICLPKSRKQEKQKCIREQPRNSTLRNLPSLSASKDTSSSDILPQAIKPTQQKKPQISVTNSAAFPIASQTLLYKTSTQLKSNHSDRVMLPPQKKHGEQVSHSPKVPVVTRLFNAPVPNQRSRNNSRKRSDSEHSDVSTGNAEIETQNHNQTGNTEELGTLNTEVSNRKPVETEKDLSSQTSTGRRSGKSTNQVCDKNVRHIKLFGWVTTPVLSGDKPFIKKPADRIKIVSCSFGAKKFSLAPEDDELKFTVPRMRLHPKQPDFRDYMDKKQEFYSKKVLDTYVRDKRKRHTEKENYENEVLKMKKGGALKWVSPLLNERQKSAVRRILSGYTRPLPYIIFGPPGTGKTMTMVEAILQIYMMAPFSRILVCTPSNSSCDLLAVRLLSSGKLGESSLVRFLAAQRDQDLVPEVLWPYCDRGEDLGLVVRHRIIVSTCSNVGTLYTLGLKEGHFTHIFMDEAGQATEPETLVALSLIDVSRGQIVLAGDPLQLGPVLMSEAACCYGLGQSFLERICNRPMYQRDTERFGDHGNYDPLLITKLVNSYRAHPSILHIYSSAFYEDELVPCAPMEDREKLLNSTFLPNKQFPVVFHAVRVESLKEGDCPSWFNAGEAFIACRYLRQLYQIGVEPKDVGIITPYRKQVQKIRQMMETFSLSIPKIGSVEEFQGQERQAIILSCVRSCHNMKNLDNVHYLGFLLNPKRFNVSISRAKALLVVLGNPDVLCKDPNWERLIEYCRKNNAIVDGDAVAEEE